MTPGLILIWPWTCPDCRAWRTATRLMWRHGIAPGANQQLEHPSCLLFLSLPQRPARQFPAALSVVLGVKYVSQKRVRKELQFS